MESRSQIERHIGAFQEIIKWNDRCKDVCRTQRIDSADNFQICYQACDERNRIAIIKELKDILSNTTRTSSKFCDFSIKES